MKAILYRTYGSPDVLKCVDVEKPVPGAHEVLMKVHASAVNPYDWHFMRGAPYLIRLITGLRRPKDPWLGVDVAGRIEAIGGDITALQTGDEVFGIRKRAFAEYACASESELAI